MHRVIPLEYTFVFLVGACIGSFLNVCIYRIPRHLSLLRPGSRCPRCGVSIRWRDNIPIVSYLLLKGRCRNCGKPIPARYPLVECLTAVSYSMIYFLFGMSISFVGYSIFSTLLILVFFIDLYHRIIPDVVTIPGIAVGFLFSWLAPRTSVTSVRPWLAEDVGSSLFGVLLGSGVLLLTAYGGKFLFRKDAMGGGDVTLAAMVGAFLGWKYLLFTLFVSFLSGSLTGLVLVVLRKKSMASIIPFGPFISGSALFALFYGEKLLTLYLRLYV